MNEGRRPYVWQMVKEAVQALGSPTTNIAVRNWILEKYPGTRVNTIQCQTVVCTVNHNSRIHYPENQRPRVAKGPYDFLFRPARGMLEWYDRERHGKWSIVETEDGAVKVEIDSGPDGISNASAPSMPGQPGISEALKSARRFAKEAHLRDYLSKNLAEIEAGLELYTSDDDVDGVEFDTRQVGRIDILAVDVRNTLVVIELKVDETPDEVCGQIMRYMGWVRRHLVDGEEVRGIIIGQNISDSLRYAVADLKNVELREYELSVRLVSVPHIDTTRLQPPHI